MRGAAVVLLIGLHGTLGSALIAAESVVVTEISGQTTTGVLKSWSSDKIVLESTTGREIAAAEIRSIAFEHTFKKRSAGDASIWLSSGDRISARTMSTTGEMLSVSWPVLGTTTSPKIPLEQVLALVLDWPATTGERQRLFADIATLPAGSDLVLLKNGDRTQGELEKIDAAFVELKGATGIQKLDRSRIRAIRLNPELASVSRWKQRRFVLTLSDDSRITATSIDLVDDRIQVNSPGLGSLVLPITSIITCQIVGETVIPVSDYEPAKVEFTPYLSTKWQLVRNANVKHGPLLVRDTEFGFGLGMHSRMAVSYDLQGNEREFQSIVGIDDMANGAGSAVFAVELDGRRVWTSTELTGKSAALSSPRIEIKGGKRLTLLVDFGQIGDVSDFADWCNAVFILDRKP